MWLIWWAGHLALLGEIYTHILDVNPEWRILPGRCRHRAQSNIKCILKRGRTRRELWLRCGSVRHPTTGCFQRRDKIRLAVQIISSLEHPCPMPLCVSLYWNHYLYYNKRVSKDFPSCSYGKFGNIFSEEYSMIFNQDLKNGINPSETKPENNQ
jgi:hypothetical protein